MHSNGTSELKERGLMDKCRQNLFKLSINYCVFIFFDIACEFDLKMSARLCFWLGTRFPGSPLFPRQFLICMNIRLDFWGVNMCCIYININITKRPNLSQNSSLVTLFYLLGSIKNLLPLDPQLKSICDF